MLSAFLSRLRLPGITSTQTTNQQDNDDASSLNRSLNLPWPVTESSLRRAPGPSSISTQGVNISNPIPRITPISLTGFGYDEHATAPSVYNSIGSARQVQGGPSIAPIGPASGAPPGGWYEPEKPRGRRLLPPPDVDAPAQTQAQAQAAAAALAPPAVVRLDSGAFAAASADNSEDQNDEDAHPPTYAYSYTSHPPSASAYAVPYPYSKPYPGPVYTTAAAVASAHTQTQSHDSWNAPTPRANTARLPYHSSPDLDGQVDDAELYTSPFESDFQHAGFPMPPKSTTNTSSTSSATDNENGSTGAGPMTKSRWGLKLQLQQLHMASASMPSLPVSGGSHPLDSGNTNQQQQNLHARYTHPTHGHGHTGVQSSESNEGMDTDVYNHAYSYPLVKQLSPIAEQDYVSPSPHSESEILSLRFGKSSGALAGSKQNSAKASPGVESILGSLAGAKSRNGGGVGVEDDRASMRTRTGSADSVRTVNRNGGGTGMNLSRAGSMTLPADTPAGQKGPHAATLGAGGNGSAGSGSERSEITRPSPIHPSPFITRHLNRTVSQTSSKSDSQAPPLSQTPTHSQTHTPAPSQPSTPGITARVPVALLSTASPISRATASPTTNTTANINAGITVQTPTSAGSTTTAPMYTPTSTLQTPVTQTPISATVIQHPPGAILASGAPTTPGPSGGAMPLTKIPSLPAMSPIDLRFSTLGSVRPRADRNSTITRTSVAGTTLKGGVDRMPIIHGSVEGYYEEEDEDDEDAEEEGEGDYEEEEYDRESLHAESFVTAGSNEENTHEDSKETNDPNGAVELGTLGKYTRTGGSASHRASTCSERLPAGALPGSRRSSRSESRTAAQIGPPQGRTTPASATGESFIHRRWDRDAGFSSPTTFRAKFNKSGWPFRLSSSSSSSFTPAFWAFWLGFVCPILWLVGGWHFTNAGEMPPKYTVWEWYFWKRRWSVRVWCRVVGGRVRNTFGQCVQRRQGKKDVRKSQDSEGTLAEPQQEPPQRRNKGKRRSDSHSKLRDGKVYPSLPRWVAERQTTDDGRMKLNDPKRSLRGISYGYPFISRPPTSQDSYSSNPIPLPDAPRSRFLKATFGVLGKPNRILDQLYGVKLKEVRGRPESGRRMFDPWIQRCRYAFCWVLLLIAMGLCAASIFLIIVNTKRLDTA